MADLLKSFKTFAKKTNAYFSGHVELCDDTDVPSGLEVFAQESDGSRYALWRQKGKPREQAPVVYLCSEGDADTVVASNLREFLALLRLDMEEVGCSYAVKRSPDSPAAPARKSYLQWADANGVPAPPKAAKTVVTAARKQFPDFKTWLDEKRGVSRTASAKPAPVEIPDKGVLAFEMQTDVSKLEKHLGEFVTALGARVGDVKAETDATWGLTSKRQESFHETAKLPTDIADVVLTSRWYLGENPEKKRVLTVAPPGRSESKRWEITLYLTPFPSEDADAMVDLKAFDKLMKKAGKVAKRRGNATVLVS